MRASYQFNRTWKTHAPVPSRPRLRSVAVGSGRSRDSVGRSVHGLLTRRLDLDLTAGYSNGEVGPDRQLQRMLTYTGRRAAAIRVQPTLGRIRRIPVLLLRFQRRFNIAAAAGHVAGPPAKRRPRRTDPVGARSGKVNTCCPEEHTRPTISCEILLKRAGGDSAARLWWRSSRRWLSRSTSARLQVGNADHGGSAADSR